MIWIYNIISLLLAPLFALWALFYLLVNTEKREALPQRLGFDLGSIPTHNKRVLWIHALSVGEITSAYHLVKELHQQHGHSTTIVFSTTTVSGHQLAQRLIAPYCDSLIYSPLDFLPVVKIFQKKIQPDLFVLIETDFWPNMLTSLSRSKVPLLLFNGRISERSMRRYRRLSFFFTPLFDKFTSLCMQTTTDKKNMVGLGIDEGKVTTLGNLKFGGCTTKKEDSALLNLDFPADSIVLFAGSTHGGEEEAVLDAFVRLQNSTTSRLHLVIAPRKISRCNEIIGLIRNLDLSYHRYASSESDFPDITIIDTIGDLPTLYQFADVSFIGGSLVDEGGHNPLEATCWGCPVLFGPHMTDFSEISRDLVECGAALMVKDQQSLCQSLELLLSDEATRQEMGAQALSYSTGHDHVIADHLRLIDRYL